MVYADANITTALGLFQYMNTVTTNTFWNLFIIILFFLSFMGLKAFRTETALSASAFFMTMVSFILWMLGLSHQLFIVGFSILTAISFFFLV